MGIDPAKELLRKDRILSFEEFRRAREVYGARRKKPLLRRFLRGLKPLPLTISFRTASFLGFVLFFSSALLYGVLTTCIVRDNYRLEETKRSSKNLSLALTQQKLTNESKLEELKFNEKKAGELGLSPVKKRIFIVRTNIYPEKANARTVEGLYPLSDEIITIEP